MDIEGLFLAAPLEDEVDSNISATTEVQRRIIKGSLKEVARVLVNRNVDVLVIHCLCLALDDVVRDSDAPAPAIKPHIISDSGAFVKPMEVRPLHGAPFAANGNRLIVYVVDPMQLVDAVGRVFTEEQLEETLDCLHVGVPFCCVCVYACIYR